MNSPLDRFTVLLGSDVFLVPCEWGTKKPLVTYVERPFAGTQSDAYRALFTDEANIAVYLGKASGGLCAIDFDTDADANAFLELNPTLGATTRSVGSRGCMLWLRIDGEYPESCNPAHKHFEWRADKRLSTIAGRHPKGMNYKLVCDAPPMSVKFADIAWPDDWQLPWVVTEGQMLRSELGASYGMPFYTSKDGKVTGVNERFWAALYSTENTVLFDPETDSFWRYADDTGLWSVVSQDHVREAISARMFEISRESDQRTLENHITSRKLTAIVTALKGIVEKRGAFRGRHSFVHVANGAIRFTEDGDVQFGGFAPEDYSRNRSPIEFNPDAECPRFINELIKPAVAEDDASLLQRWAGLALFGYNLPQRFLILDGMPNGGKGTLVRIIQSILGVENCTQLRTELLERPFELFQFIGKTLLIGPDAPGDFLQREGAFMLKALVGGDPVTAEGKHRNGGVQLLGTWNIVITCNSRLRVRLDGDTGAWRRRLLIVRYEKPPVEKRILDFDAVLLKEEGAGILRWALEGLVKLQEEFVSHGDFVLSDRQRNRIDSLLNESDSLRVFLRERVERGPGELTTQELVTAYSDFCADSGWNALPITLIAKLSIDLMLDMFRVTQSNSITRGGRNARGWRNIRLKNVVSVNAVPQEHDAEFDIDYPEASEPGL